MAKRHHSATAQLFKPFLRDNLRLHGSEIAPGCPASTIVLRRTDLP